MLLLVAASGCTPPPKRSRPYDGYLPGTAPENVSVTIVRHAVTGAPLAGVRLRQYLETIDPRTPRAPLLAESTTDEFGIVSVTWTGEIQDCHWVFEKPGYAVIRGRQEFRGPVARTSGDGRFRLSGAAPSQAFLVHGPEGGSAYVYGRAIEPDRALTVVLRADEENDGRPDWKAEMVPLRFDVVDADSGASVSDARVSLHRPEDGWVFRANLADEETLDAPLGCADLRRTLGSSDPHLLEWGGASLEVEVPEAPDFVVYIDGQLFAAEKGRAHVSGLEAGPHTVIVAAPGRRGQVLQIKCGEAERRALRVALPPR